MIVEGQFRVSVHTRKFNQVYFLECLATDCIRCLDWFLLQCYPQHLALGWVKLHEPCIRPPLPSVCVMLEGISIVT